MKKLLFVALFFLGVSNAQDSDQVVADAKAKIAMKMKDPESARFADIAVSSKGGIVCGWINAKNSFGGYVGYKPFYVMGRFAEVRDDASAGSLNNHITFDAAWGICYPADGESFGDALVALPKVNSDKHCAKLERTLGRPLEYDCRKLESEAKSWLETHGTASWIAMRCASVARQSGSYGSGRSCVEKAEAEIVYERGPRQSSSASP